MSRTHWVINSSVTTTSGQTAAMIASRSTTRPGFSTRSRSSAKDFGRSGTSAPSGPSKAPRARSRVKRSKRQAARCPFGVHRQSLSAWRRRSRESADLTRTSAEFHPTFTRLSGGGGAIGVSCARRNAPPRPNRESSDAVHHPDPPHRADDGDDPGRRRQSWVGNSDRSICGVCDSQDGCASSRRRPCAAVVSAF